MADSIPPEIVDELCCRFIINVPREAKTDLIRICFNIELALWFYIDFFQEKKSSIGMRNFARIIFNHIPSLRDKAAQLDEILLQWKDYKLTVPTYGGIILDKSKEYVLLVQAFWPKTTWGFPKGKVNEGEPPHECAIREVLEETGFDIRPYIKEEEFIERQVHGQVARLYIICDVPMNIEFKPKTRNEIKDMQWFKISNLPCHKKDNTPKMNLGLNTNAFFMVIPFVKDMRKWITKMCLKASHSGRYKTRYVLNSKDGVFNDNKCKPINSKQVSVSPSNHLVNRDGKKSDPPASSNHKVVTGHSSPHIHHTKKDKRKRANRAYSPPPRMLKLKQQQQNQMALKSDSIQILNRDGSVSGKNSKSDNVFSGLENNFNPIIQLCSAWKNFRFDRQKIFNRL